MDASSNSPYVAQFVIPVTKQTGSELCDPSQDGCQLAKLPINRM